MTDFQWSSVLQVISPVLLREGCSHKLVRKENFIVKPQFSYVLNNAFGTLAGLEMISMDGFIVWYIQ